MKQMQNNTKPTVLAVIPARGGSKRLPRKNISKISGMPMIAYTISAAQKANLVTDWLVSSEDEEIIEIANALGAPTPYVRPPELATDEIRNIDVVLHALKFMEKERGITYDIIVLLQPTSPIRSSKHIDQAVERLWNSDLPTLAAVKGPFQKRDPILKRIDEDGNLVPYCVNSDLEPREPFYIYNAALYAVKRDYFLKNKKFVSEKQVPLIMDKAHSVDVDEIVDLIVAEAYLNRIKNKEEMK